MANAISADLYRGHPYRAARPRQHAAFSDDPLGSMRGIVFGTLISLALFWLPLALLIAAR